MPAVGQGEACHTLTAAQASALTTLAIEKATTVDQLVQAAWALVLSRLTGEPEVVFGFNGAGECVRVDEQAPLASVLDQLSARAEQVTSGRFETSLQFEGSVLTLRFDRQRLPLAVAARLVAYLVGALEALGAVKVLSELDVLPAAERALLLYGSTTPLGPSTTRCCCTSSSSNAWPSSLRPSRW